MDVGKAMVKKILVISCSPRIGGNSDVLANAFIEGATKAGHIVEKVNLAGKRLNFVKGALRANQQKDVGFEMMQIALSKKWNKQIYWFLRHLFIIMK